MTQIPEWMPKMWYFWVVTRLDNYVSKSDTIDYKHYTHTHTETQSVYPNRYTQTHRNTCCTHTNTQCLDQCHLLLICKGLGFGEVLCLFSNWKKTSQQTEARTHTCKHTLTHTNTHLNTCHLWHHVTWATCVHTSQDPGSWEWLAGLRLCAAIL